jgi:hypothetical protein
VDQLHAVKAEHGLKASAPDKRALVGKLAERFRAHRQTQAPAGKRALEEAVKDRPGFHNVREVVGGHAVRHGPTGSQVRADHAGTRFDVLTSGSTLHSSHATAAAAVKAAEASNRFGTGQSTAEQESRARHEAIANAQKRAAAEKPAAVPKAEKPTHYHATYAQVADDILRHGLKPSADGTAGPGVYLADTPKDAFYERRPTAVGVQTHGGQPDTLVGVKVKGKLYDAGTQNTKDGWDVYVKPHMKAAKELFDNMGMAMRDSHPEFVRRMKALGYVGIKWKFWDGRTGTLVFDPADVKVIGHRPKAVGKAKGATFSVHGALSPEEAEERATLRRVESYAEHENARLRAVREGVGA